MKQQFSEVDFVAYLLHAGAKTSTINADSMAPFELRLEYIERSNEFFQEYLKPKYPHHIWLDFIHQYREWVNTQRREQDEQETNEERMD